MEKIYYQLFSGRIVFTSILSGFFGIMLLFYWKNTGSVSYLFFAILPLLVFIVFARPVIESRRIGIENEYIIIYKRFLKPLRLNISESLFQIVIKDEIIQHFRFRNGIFDIQISPSIFKDGDEMIKAIETCLKRDKKNVEIIIKS